LTGDKEELHFDTSAGKDVLQEEVPLSEIGSAAEAMRYGQREASKVSSSIRQEEEADEEEVVEKLPSVEEVEQEPVVDEETATAGMTDIQKRLFKIRMRMNQGRKVNKKEVENEYKRFADPKFEAKQRYYEKQEELKKERMKANKGREIGEGGVEDRDLVGGGGGVAGDDPVMLITAEAAERAQEKALIKEKNMATFGLQVIVTVIFLQTRCNPCLFCATQSEEVSVNINSLGTVQRCHVQVVQEAAVQTTLFFLLV
jgi:hypothetical protein